jgi:hypothetical protein
MLGEVIEAAAELADTSEPTVAAALVRYQHLPDPACRQGQIWVSVAFMLDRHDRITATFP